MEKFLGLALGLVLGMNTVAWADETEIRKACEFTEEYVRQPMDAQFDGPEEEITNDKGEKVKVRKNALVEIRKQEQIIYNNTRAVLCYYAKKKQYLDNEYGKGTLSREQWIKELEKEKELLEGNLRVLHKKEVQVLHKVEDITKDKVRIAGGIPQVQYLLNAYDNNLITKDASVLHSHNKKAKDADDLSGFTELRDGHIKRLRKKAEDGLFTPDNFKGNERVATSEEEKELKKEEEANPFEGGLSRREKKEFRSMNAKREPGAEEESVVGLQTANLSDLSKLSDAELKAMTKEQVQALTPEQLKKLSAAQLALIQDKLTPEQRKALGIKDVVISDEDTEGSAACRGAEVMKRAIAALLENPNANLSFSLKADLADILPKGEPSIEAYRTAGKAARDKCEAEKTSAKSTAEKCEKAKAELAYLVLTKHSKTLSEMSNVAAMKMAYRLKVKGPGVAKKDGTWYTMESYINSVHKNADYKKIETDLVALYQKSGEAEDAAKAKALFESSAQKLGSGKAGYTPRNVRLDNATSSAYLLYLAKTEEGEDPVLNFTEADAAAVWAQQEVIEMKNLKPGSVQRNLLSFPTQVYRLLNSDFYSQKTKTMVKSRVKIMEIAMGDHPSEKERSMCHEIRPNEYGQLTCYVYGEKDEEKTVTSVPDADDAKAAQGKAAFKTAEGIKNAILAKEKAVSDKVQAVYAENSKYFKEKHPACFEDDGTVCQDDMNAVKRMIAAIASKNPDSTEAMKELSEKYKVETRAVNGVIELKTTPAK